MDGFMMKRDKLSCSPLVLNHRQVKFRVIVASQVYLKSLEFDRRPLLLYIIILRYYRYFNIPLLYYQLSRKAIAFYFT